MRKIKKEMNISEVEQILSYNIDSYIQNTADSIKSLNLDFESEQINEIIDDTYFNIKIKALKIMQAMNILNKDAF